MRTERLPASFGVAVDLDLRPRAPTDAEAGELKRLMDAHGLLVFRRHGLTGAEQMRATGLFGRIMQTADGKPMELYVSNRRQSSAPDGELIFHYDYAYDRNPIDFISLYGDAVEAGATPTLFASSARALDALPADLRARVEGRSALHACFLDRAAPAEARARIEDDAIPRGAPGWGSKDWRIAHPLVWRNRRGVPMLFACIQHTVRVLGMQIAESDLLLERLFAHLYAPANVYRHDWRNGDLVVWDNRTVQHCRPRPNDVARTLRRYEVCDEDLTEIYLAIGRAEGFV